MKKLAFVFLVMTLCLQALEALCQVKSDFSDWNVPPPIPAGTIPKGPGGAKLTVTQTPTDIPAPNLQLIELRLAALSPILQTAPDVQAPEQPQFPALPFNVPDIPLPKIPLPVNLPKQTPHDQIIEHNTDMPEPGAPEMPEFPKIPDVTQSSPNQGSLKFPVMPAIIVQPVTIALPDNAFPFLEWPVPEIPENAQLHMILSGNSSDNNVKPINKKRTAKKLKGG
ncbi:MAG TPA: hypothetical protein VFE53_04740 [Mucilaginibacter sp.]|jgi:hypothetical protein|nr:hypothetical protein [Mucilaginibacter sp.]